MKVYSGQDVAHGFTPEDREMKLFKNNFIKVLGFVLFFGLCIFMAGGVNANAADKEPQLNLSSCNVTVDGTYWLRVYNLDGKIVAFRSSDPSIVTVSNSGRLKGRNCGDAVVTAIVSQNGSVVSTLQCDVHIGPAAVSIRFTSKRLVLKEGTAKRIYPLVYPKNTVEKPVYWTDDADVATISPAGTVRAQSTGSVDIHGTLENGDSDTCRVIVLSSDDYESYRVGRKSLEDIVSDMSNSDAQESNTETEESVTAVPDTGVVTPTPTVAPVTVPVTAPVAGK